MRGKQKKFRSFGTKVAIMFLTYMIVVMFVAFLSINLTLMTSIKRDYEKLLDMSISSISWDMKRLYNRISQELERFLKTKEHPEDILYIVEGNKVIFNDTDLPDDKVLSVTNNQCTIYKNLVVKNILIKDHIIGLPITEDILRSFSRSLKGNGFVAVEVCGRVITPYFVDSKELLKKLINRTGKFKINVGGETFIGGILPAKDLTVYAFLSIHLFNEIQTKLSILLTTFFGISIIMMAFVSWRIARYLSSNLKMILDGFEKLREGQFEFLEIKSNDELALMMAEFNVTVSVLKDAIEKLKMAKEMAEEANKTKSMFLASVSHEIRTPLNSILGFTELLLKEETDPKKREYLKTIYQSGEHLLNVINDILDLSKIEAGRMELSFEVYDPVALVEEIVKMYMPIALKKKVNLTYRIENNIPRDAIGDPFRIKQILINLVSNALKFTSEGYVIIRLRREGEYLIYTVEDTGIGIPKEKIDSIFEPFVQADASVSRKFGGTGLGLTISKKLANLMKGDLWIESELGKGTKVFLKLPIKVVEDMTVSESKKISESPDTVVLYLKNPILEEMVEKLIRELKLKAKQVNSIKEAENLARKIHPRVTIVQAESTGDVKGFLRQAGTIVFLPPETDTIRLKNVLFLPSNISLDQLKEEISLFLNISFKDSIRIALVEDNEINRKVIIAMMNKFLNIKDLTEFENGEKIVNYLKDFEELSIFDLVLMDAQMPVMDGFTATRKLREIGFKGVIIMVSASVSTEDIKKAIEAGCDDFVPKPVKIEDLKLKILKYFPKALKENTDESEELKESEIKSSEAPEAAETEPLEEKSKKDYRAVKIDEDSQPQKEYLIDTDGSKGDVKSAIDQIMKEMEMDEDMALGMIKDYIKFLKRKLVALEEAIVKKDQMLARKVGHDLSGSGGMYGFPKITEFGDTIRKFAKEDNFSALQTVYEKLKTLINNYEKSLQTIESGHN